MPCSHTQNIFVFERPSKTEQGNHWLVKIGDFGITKNTLTQHTTLHTNVGTEGYKAPEIIGFIATDDESRYDAKCDIWSLGCLLLEVLTASLPFRRPAALRSYCSSPFSYLREIFPQAANIISDSAFFVMSQLLTPAPHDRPDAEQAFELVCGWVSGQALVPDHSISTALVNSQEVSQNGTVKIQHGNVVAWPSSVTIAGNVTVNLGDHAGSHLGYPLTPTRGDVIEETYGTEAVQSREGSQSQRIISTGVYQQQEEIKELRRARPKAIGNYAKNVSDPEKPTFSSDLKDDDIRRAYPATIDHGRMNGPFQRYPETYYLPAKSTTESQKKQPIARGRFPIKVDRNQQQQNPRESPSQQSSDLAKAIPDLSDLNLREYNQWTQEQAQDVAAKSPVISAADTMLNYLINKTRGKISQQD